MKLAYKCALVAACFFFVGCAGLDPGLKVDVSEDANPWTHLNFNNDPDNLQFAIVADRTGGMRPGVFKDAVEKLNLLQPEFVMCVGDLIPGDTEDPTELDRQWDEFDGLVDKLQMPFFYLPGNHDIGNEAMAQKWRQRLGQSYYHFVYRNVLFLCLNTEDPPPDSISDQQFEYLRKALNANTNVRWTFVFMHKPMWRGQNETWQKIESLLVRRQYTLFGGHKHRYEKEIRSGKTYYLLATTGGAGGDNDENPCQFDHMAWVTMTDAGPVMANLMLEGIAADQPCTLR